MVDEFEVDHLGRVALARAELHDPGIAARAVGEARPDLGEELVDDVLGAQVRDRLPARVDVAAPAEGDHLLGDRLDRLRLRLRRPDAPVLDQRAREVGVERLAVRGVAAELLPRAVVPHYGPSSPRRLRPCADSVSLTSSIDFFPKFGIAASSFSVFVTRSPIVSMPTRLRQLYERTPSSSSSIGKFSIPCASGISAGAPSACAASPKPSMRSRSVKIASCLIRISDAWAIASFGDSEPSVVTSRRSLSKSVRCPTRAASTSYATRRTGEKIESMGITPMVCSGPRFSSDGTYPRPRPIVSVISSFPRSDRFAISRSGLRI